MNKKLIIILVAVLLIAVGLSWYFETNNQHYKQTIDKSKFYGYWKSENNLFYDNYGNVERNYTYYKFIFENGSIIMRSEYTSPNSDYFSGGGYDFENWTIKNDMFLITLWSSEYVYNYEFVNEATLKLINPANSSEYQVYTKYNSAWECYEE